LAARVLGTIGRRKLGGPPLKNLTNQTESKKEEAKKHRSKKEEVLTSKN